MSSNRREKQPPGQPMSPATRVAAGVGLLVIAAGLVLVVMDKLDVVENPGATTSSQTVIGWVLMGAGFAAVVVACLVAMRRQDAEPRPKSQRDGGRRDR